MRLFRQLVFRDQPAAQQQRIARIFDFRSCDRPSVFVDLRQNDTFHPLFSFDIHDRMRKLERDPEIIQALHDIALQSARIRHQLRHHMHFRPFQAHPSRHDQANIPRSKDHDISARHEAVDIDQLLRRSRRVNASRPVSGNIKRAPGTFPASHCKNDRISLYCLQTVFIHERHLFICIQIKDHRIQKAIDAQIFHLVNETLRIFRTRQLLMKRMQAKPVMDTLIQDAAQTLVPLQDHDVIQARLFRSARSRKSRRTSPDHDQLFFIELHPDPPCSFP